MELDKLLSELRRLSEAEVNYSLTSGDKNTLRIAANEIQDLHSAVCSVRDQIKKTIATLGNGD